MKTIDELTVKICECAMIDGNLGIATMVVGAACDYGSSDLSNGELVSSPQVDNALVF